MITITEHSPIHSYISNPYIVRNLLSIGKVYWEYNADTYKKERKEYRKFFINNKGMFLTGFTNKILKHLGDRNQCIVNNIEYEIEHSEPHLPGITFREDQIRQMNIALEKRRGVILAPTGTGKTVLMAGLISCFPKSRILFLVHTIDLVNQAIAEFTKFGLGTISKVGDGKKDLSGRIVVSTVQSFAKLHPKDYCDVYDVVFVDEAHHTSGFPDKSKPLGGVFYRVLSNLLAPVRIAVTATLPSDPDTAFCLEGLIGEVIDEFSFQEATDKNILAVPKLQLIKVDPFSDYDIRTYLDVYQKAIVENEERNYQILKAVKDLNKQGLSTVTYVQRKEHIDHLMRMAPNMSIKLFDVQGKTSGDVRVELKNALHKKKIMNVVATVVWREGINIKSLNAIIIAGGGKNEKDLIQACGRGARKDVGKDEFVIVDFIDSAKYLSQHFCERLGVYVKKGWL